MAFRKRVIQFLVLSFIMAVWQLYLSDMYENWLTLNGKTLGLGELMLANFILMLIAFIATEILVPGGEK
ncbi:hypothetical protein DRO69_00465 [Candidatus Bathyarchaeota archaeon]|nr:MAG: hypothetical protein DRO69_00465 [Candidatus Bathyarchaeota archaeon]